MPIEGLTLGSAISYLDTEIGSFIGSNQVGQEIEFDGSEFPFSANWQSRFDAKYEWDISSNLVETVAAVETVTAAATVAVAVAVDFGTVTYCLQVPPPIKIIQEYLRNISISISIRHFI